LIFFAKPVLTEDLYVVKKEEFSVTWYKCDSSERLHKDYCPKGSVDKVCGELWFPGLTLKIILN
jgi:hypothetical protein